MHWLIWLVCTFIFFFFIGWWAKQAPLCPSPPPPHPPRFGWSCNEDLKHQTLGCFDLYPAFINKCHRLFSFSFSFSLSLSSVSSSSSPALLSKSHIQYVSYHFDTKLKLRFYSNLGTFFFKFSFVKMHFHTCSPYYSLVKRKWTWTKINFVPIQHHNKYYIFFLGNAMLQLALFGLTSNLKPTDWLAQWDKYWSAEREAIGSNPSRTNTQGL